MKQKPQYIQSKTSNQEYKMRLFTFPEYMHFIFYEQLIPQYLFNSLDIQLSKRWHAANRLINFNAHINNDTKRVLYYMATN